MRDFLFIKSILSLSLRRISGWILLALIFASCAGDNHVVYSDFISIGNEGMRQGKIYAFSPMPLDSSESIAGKFDLILVVRYTNSCASASVVLDTERMSISQTKPDSARIFVPLFDPEGTPCGMGSLGIYETSDTLAKGISITGDYALSVSTPLPPDATQGIIAIGAKLVRSGSKEFDILDILKQ